MFKHEITIANSARLQKSIVAMYDLELEGIKAEDTRVTLANILYSRDQSEVNAIKIAYHLSRITDEQGQAEGYKSGKDMIMAVTGLKKSMVSNYIKVARALFTDQDGEFFMPDHLKGFTIGQLTEGLEKAGSIQLLEDIVKNEITPDMSAKSIREYYKDKAAVETTATEVETETTETATESTESADLTGTPIKATSNEEIFNLCIVDMNNNPIALVTPINGYTTEGVLAMFPDNINLKEVRA